MQHRETQRVGLSVVQCSFNMLTEFDKERFRRPYTKTRASLGWSITRDYTLLDCIVLRGLRSNLWFSHDFWTFLSGTYCLLKV